MAAGGRCRGWGLASGEQETCHAERGNVSHFTASQAESEIPFVPQGVPRSLRSPGIAVLDGPCY